MSSWRYIGGDINCTSGINPTRAELFPAHSLWSIVCWYSFSIRQWMAQYITLHFITVTAYISNNNTYSNNNVIPQGSSQTYSQLIKRKLNI